MKLSKNTYIGKSKIHGKGVFAKKDISANEEVGPAVLSAKPLRRTEIGKMINHSSSPNSFLKEKGDVFVVEASKKIPKGKEITLDYSKAEKVLGIKIDKSFLKEGAFKLSKYADSFDFEVLEPLSGDIEEELPEPSDDETGEVDMSERMHDAKQQDEKRKSAPEPVEPILKELFEPVDWDVEELEKVLKELEAARKRPLLSKRARRIGVKEEYVWMYVHGRLFVDKNVENEKELLGIGHSGLAEKAGVTPKQELPRGFVTYYDDGKIEIQTYGVSFWEMPTRVQNRVESWFDLSPGQYQVEKPLSLPPGTSLYV